MLQNVQSLKEVTDEYKKIDVLFLIKYIHTLPLYNVY